MSSSAASPSSAWVDRASIPCPDSSFIIKLTQHTTDVRRFFLNCRRHYINSAGVLVYSSSGVFVKVDDLSTLATALGDVMAGEVQGITAQGIHLARVYTMAEDFIFMWKADPCKLVKDYRIPPEAGMQLNRLEAQFLHSTFPKLENILEEVRLNLVDLTAGPYADSWL